MDFTKYVIFFYLTEKMKYGTITVIIWTERYIQYDLLEPIILTVRYILEIVDAVAVDVHKGCSLEDNNFIQIMIIEEGANEPLFIQTLSYWKYDLEWGQTKISSYQFF